MATLVCVRLLGIVLVVVALAVLAGSAGAAQSPVAPEPAVVWKPIPFDAKRRAETAAYARRHYGLDTWRLTRPHVIVEHLTLSSSFASTWSAFAADVPDSELHELPGLCTHFVVDRDGTIYQLVRLDTICRHTVGLNWTAIGVENVGSSDREVLRNPRQLDASLRLALWLATRFHIPLRDVIGHAESLGSPYHRERVAAYRCQTHGDWTAADMQVYRRALARLAARYGVSIGHGVVTPTSRCRG